MFSELWFLRWQKKRKWDSCGCEWVDVIHKLKKFCHFPASTYWLGELKKEQPRKTPGRLGLQTFFLVPLKWTFNLNTINFIKRLEYLLCVSGLYLGPYKKFSPLFLHSSSMRKVLIYSHFTKSIRLKAWAPNLIWNGAGNWTIQFVDRVHVLATTLQYWLF